MPRKLLVIGSGSLARALCHAYAVLPDPADGGSEVTVLARDGAKADEVAFVSQARATVADAEVRFHGRAADLDRADALDDAVADADVVVQCASLHSPWRRGTPWADQIARAGFGVTLPLQARLVIETATAVRRTGSSALLVNGCFPDAVNPLLSRLGLPVLCGIGNVATIAASLAAATGTRPADRLRLLAHHVHLHAPDRPEDEARAWVDGAPVADVGRLLATGRTADRAALNHIGGYAAARLVADLLAGRDVVANLPGPDGLPGGYPVRIADGRISLDLPPGLDAAAAVSFNEAAGERDGLRLDGDRVHFTTPAARSAPGLAGGFAIGDTVAVAQRLYAT